MFKSMEAAKSELIAKGYKAMELRGALYVCGPFVNKYLYPNVNGEIAAFDVDSIKDVTKASYPATSLRAG